MSNNDRIHRTHTDGHTRRHRVRTNPHGPPRGYHHPHAASGHSTGQVHYSDDSYASLDAGDTGVTNTQNGFNSTTSEASMVGFQRDGMGHSHAAFNRSEYDPTYSITLPEEEDGTEAEARYAPPSTDHYPYPPNNSFDPLSTALASTSPALYYSNSSHQAFASDSIVSYTGAQTGYTSFVAGDVALTVSSSPSFGVWGDGNGMGGGSHFSQGSDPGVHYERVRTGSGDSGDSSSSVHALQGSVVDSTGQSSQVDTLQAERWRARPDYNEHRSDHIRVYVDHRNDPWSPSCLRGPNTLPHNDENMNEYVGEEVEEEESTEQA